MQLVKNRVPRYPGRVDLSPVSGNVYDMTRADQPTQAGTPVNAELLNAIYGFDNVKTVFNQQRQHYAVRQLHRGADCDRL